MLHPIQNIKKFLRQIPAALLFQIIRHTVKSFRDGTCNAGQCIAVTAKGNGGADHIFKGFAFQKGGDGLGDGFLTGLYMIVGWTNFVAGAAKIIMEIFFDICLDFLLGVAGSGKENSGGGGFRTLNALGVVMGYFGRKMACLY